MNLISYIFLKGLEIICGLMVYLLSIPLIFGISNELNIMSTIIKIFGVSIYLFVLMPVAIDILLRGFNNKSISLKSMFKLWYRMERRPLIKILTCISLVILGMPEPIKDCLSIDMMIVIIASLPFYLHSKIKGDYR